MGHTYIICARRRDGNAFTNEPGPVRFLKVPGSVKTQYDASHIVTNAKAWALEVQALADGDENPNSIAPKGDVLVFVHGYNNGMVDILQRTRQLNADLRAEGWRGQVIAFDWPSANQTLNYLEDRSDGAQVALSLVNKAIRLLSDGQKAGCETNVHLLAHSAGAYVVMEAFIQAEKYGPLNHSPWRVGQVAFISGDVSLSSLSAKSEWSSSMFKRIMRFTNYYNPFDAALAVSTAKRLGVSPRAGRRGLPQDAPDRAVSVNCGPYFQELPPDKSFGHVSWTHSWYIGNRVFARDLAMTLEGAIDRDFIPTRDKVGGELRLADHLRPKFQSQWDIKSTAKLPGRFGS
jgi:pimeloyl-ACP methyl ester carboxylesterase